MASGDLVYEHVQTGVLTAGQKTSLATFLAAIWTGPLADLANVRFMRDGTEVNFMLVGQKTVAPGSLPAGPIQVLSKVP